ncbi:MAG: F0F1 ATP synthase subunit epsilon [Gammaproteobacteria bacterium]|nr:F0F1 ATP synthase subunit epsilon [Gammaproteobacteria bacterium]
MVKTVKLDIVSPEGEIFAGEAAALFVKGAEGELGLYPGHLQLLTRIAPGAVRILKADGHEELLYVSGGILEVQPHHISILADSVERPQDVNEAAALEAKQAAEKLLSAKDGSVDYRKTQQDLAEAIAKLRVLELMRLRKKH